jgi:hypothetical protein
MRRFSGSAILVPSSGRAPADSRRATPAGAARRMRMRRPTCQETRGTFSHLDYTRAVEARGRVTGAVGEWLSRGAPVGAGEAESSPAGRCLRL